MEKNEMKRKENKISIKVNKMETPNVVTLNVVTKKQIQLARVILKQRMTELKPVLKLLSKQEKKEIKDYRDELYMYFSADDTTDEMLNKLKEFCKKEEPTSTNLEKARKYYQLYECFAKANIMTGDMKKDDTEDEPRLVTIVHAII